MNKDVMYMKKVLQLAKRGEGYTGSNPLVGALIVKGNEIVGEGYHQRFGGAHAEVNALKDAGDRAQDATLYVNLEPCNHYGKTPPCTSAIIKAGISRVVIAMEDPNPRVAGKGIEVLKEANIKVKKGIMKDEAKKLNEVFKKYITTDLPFVYLKAAQTIDGFLATKDGDSKWITNKQAREYGHRLRHRVDAILVGIGTILKDDPRLTTRLAEKKGKDSLRIVLDSNLKIPLEAKIINQESSVGTLIVTSKSVDSHKKELLKGKENVEVLELVPNEEGRIPLDKLLYYLHNKNIASLLVEGGGRVNYSFLSAGLVDKIYTFIAPKIMGGSDGIATFSGPGPGRMEFVRELKSVKLKKLNDNILIIGDL